MTTPTASTPQRNVSHRSTFVIALRFVLFWIIVAVLYQLYVYLFAGAELKALNDALASPDATNGSQDGMQNVMNAYSDMVAKVFPFHLLLMAFFAAFVRKIAYRAFDVLLLLFPFVNIWYSVKWSWRLSALPDRYWASDKGGSAALQGPFNSGFPSGSGSGSSSSAEPPSSSGPKSDSPDDFWNK